MAGEPLADADDPRRSPHVQVQVDLRRIRANAEAIRQRTGVELIAVVKADAYGLGAAAVVGALRGIADRFAFFSLAEARRAGCRGALILGPPTGPPEHYAELDARPSVGRLDEARRFGALPVAVNFDSGMRRFGCDAATLREIVAAARVAEVFTHAVDLPAAAKLAALELPPGVRRHAAASALLDEPRAWLDAVRPGLALYRGALRVTARLVRVRRAAGPVGYERIEVERVGVMLVGYAHGFAPAPVRIGGRVQRVLEVGMNTSLVTVDPADREGDEVVLLGEDLDELRLAEALSIRPHAVLCRYGGLGRRMWLRP